jgi:hypothetical protein
VGQEPVAKPTAQSSWDGEVESRELFSWSEPMSSKMSVRMRGQRQHGLDPWEPKLKCLA